MRILRLHSKGWQVRLIEGYLNIASHTIARTIKNHEKMIEAAINSRKFNAEYRTRYDNLGSRIIEEIMELRNRHFPVTRRIAL